MLGKFGMDLYGLYTKPNIETLYCWHIADILIARDIYRTQKSGKREVRVSNVQCKMQGF